MDLFRKKQISDLLAQQSPLKRTLHTWDLTFLGIGDIIGTGIFVLTGKGALTTGPSLALSFLIAAICCGFAGLCYAEFASMAPVAGSAYTYSYISFGEIVAFIIGWDLLLEYALGASTVAAGWSGYFNNFIANFGIHIPKILTAAPGTTPGVTTVFNLPAFCIIILITTIVSMGINQTKRINDTMVIIKLGVIVLFLTCTVWYVKVGNWRPFTPYGIYSFHKGVASGVIPAASICFFSFIGFDSVSSSAEETVNPSKTLPRGIMLSLSIATVLYIAMSLTMTGVVKYPIFAKYIDAPILAVLAKTGQGWLSMIVSLGAILGMTTVILVQIYGQSRITYSMSRDGLFPKFFGAVSPRHQTPLKGTWFFGIITSIAAGFINLNILAELVNIGTLTAFILVSAGIIWMRKTHPEIKRDFKAPGVPFTPLISIIFCLTLVAGLNWETWLRFIIWFAIGMCVYFGYARKHSVMNKQNK
ncbi:amino acid permease [Companilactobacillus sp.]|jgi:APA family basic amino acid/polyamine antiporter|uniref:amino acid permease n=1 Tax=Companilactobacillus sp. TaxID=2767905 RepID=UPI0025BB53C5|nr:amino acid permease [Companilactobacillus sp.]MCH4010217.1 amino acid permease [Companilactobacillus sp.]MCH4052107.1 amino acid permease [Companilactobacillus sp.]MCH4078159.1 amino acid permease [Companilactobacillus sp.]MCH4126735.1 amino acid permease [Companilactobacillus sp.]MCH4132320.1 amino acid permease [Companilactobacillus sp.]